MRQMQSPYIPSLDSDEDCRRFDKFDEEEPFYPMDDKKNGKKARKDINFVGYTFKKDVEDQKSNLVRALNESLQPDMGSASSNDGTPNQKTTSASSNFYASQMGQGGNVEDILHSNSTSNSSKSAQVKGYVMEEDEDIATKNLTKVNIQMNNTGYDAGFPNLANPKGFYPPQTQMSSSQYVVKGNTSLI
mmetsp:Transcript_34253/g.25317  ORF Transcript_34253/g.25317 Transcript_34253/m.25317 type:complete len:189 (-) Transcript_34253:366-932(-)